MFNIFSLFMTLAAASPDAAKGLGFSTEFIGEALRCSLAGMVGIFVVVGVIILSVGLLNKLGSGSSKKKDK